jgi:hypothetical protein
MLRVAAVLLAFAVLLSAQAQRAPPPGAGATKPAVKKPTPSRGTAAARSVPSASTGPCIGVLAPVAEHFGMKKIGITVFGNDYKDLPADGFRLDDVVVERVRAAVGPRAVVRKISYAKGAFDSFHQSGLLFSASDNEKLATLLHQVVAGQAGCERYVVVLGVGLRYVGNQNVSGVGIVNTGGPLLSTTFVHAVMQITVHDGHTFAVIKKGDYPTGGANFLTGPPQERLRDFTWPDTPEAVDMPRVRTAARALVTETLDKTLPELLVP